jgi:hypothetical protein
VPWPAIPNRRGLRGGRPRAAQHPGQAAHERCNRRSTPLERPLRASYDVSRDPCRRASMSGMSRARGEEPTLLLPPSRIIAGEPYPLPLERTPLTVSVVDGTPQKSTVSGPSC